MNKCIIPQIIKNLDDDIREDVEKCYLAGDISRREFKQICRRCRDIDCESVLEKISRHVSSRHPLPEHAFPWVVTKRLIVGVLKVMIYSLDEGLGKADRILKNFEIPELNKLNEPWILPDVSEEPPNIKEVVMDPEKLPHIALRDIHQLNENNIIPTHEEDNNLHFGSLTSDELSIYTSDDWMKELQAREQALDQGLPQKCVHINPIGTPKRKAPGNGDSPPIGTPSKRSRRNLEDSYSEPPRPDGPGEMPVPESTDEFPAPPPHEDTDPLVQSIPIEAPSVEHPVPPEGPQPPPAEQSPPVAPIHPPDVPPASPRLPPRQRVPKPRPIQIPQATLNRRLDNFESHTVGIEDREIDIRKIQTGITGLFRDLGTIRLNPGIIRPLKKLAEQYSNDLRVREREDVEFEQSLYRAEETMLSILELTIGGEPQRDVPQNVPEESNAGEEVPGEMPIHTSPQPAVPIEIDGPPVPQPHTPPRVPDNVPIHETADETNFEEEYRAPHSRSTASKTSRSNTTFDDTNEAYTPQDGLTKREFFNKLNAKWQEKMDLYNLDNPSPVDFDEVVNPNETTANDYILGLSYAMEGMMQGRLVMKQSTPYGIVQLFKP